jgi:hypothetical protein
MPESERRIIRRTPEGDEVLEDVELDVPGSSGARTVVRVEKREIATGDDVVIEIEEELA